MKTLFSLALLALAAIPAHAQVVSPDVLVAPAPQPPARRDAMAQSTLRSADLQWIWQYAQPTPNGNKAALLADPRFAALLRDQLKTPQTFWGTNRTLSEAATDFLAGEGTVSAKQNRYFIVTGCVIDQCAQKGMLWIDLGRSTPWAVFMAAQWQEQTKTPEQLGSPFTLWVFPTQNTSRIEVPDSLKMAIDEWSSLLTGCGRTEGFRPGLVAMVDTDGTIHVLTTSDFHWSWCETTNDPVIRN